MVAVRLPASDDGPRDAAADGSPHSDDDWLPLSQAACEMGVSISTVRRMLRAGRLRNRIIPRRGGFQYLIHVPGNRHAAAMPHRCGSDAVRAQQECEISAMRKQIESLSQALARALRAHQKTVPLRVAVSAATPEEPYARYRWLVRKRRWWPLA